MLRKILHTPLLVLVPYYLLFSAVLEFTVNAVPYDDICKATNQTDFTVQPVALGSTLTVNQNKCVQQFSVQGWNSSLSKFVMFEVNFASIPTDLNYLPRLAEKALIVPKFYFNGTVNTSNIEDDINQTDYNGLFNRKKYHYIVVDISNISNTSVLYYGMYEYFYKLSLYQNYSVSYTVKATEASIYPCPKNCNSPKNGICHPDLQKCICNTGFFDDDCSVQASLVDTNITASLPVSQYTFSYFYINIKDYGSDIVLKLQIDNGSARAFLVFDQVQNYSLPNTYFGSEIKLNINASLEQSFTIKQTLLQSRKDQTLMIGVYNDGNSITNATISITPHTDSDGDQTRNAIMYAMIAVASVLIILWIIFSVMKYKVYRQAEAIRRAHQREIAERVHLTKQEIDKYFVKQNYEHLKSTFPQTMCSICLDDFTKDTVCRQLYCEHIFNDNCIEAWLANHDNCPNCKKDMTKAAIDAFLANPKVTIEEKAKSEESDESQPEQNVVSNQVVGVHSLYGNNDPGLEEIREIGSPATYTFGQKPVEAPHQYSAISVPNPRPEMVIEFEDIQENSSSRLPIRLNAEVRRLKHRPQE